MIPHKGPENLDTLFEHLDSERGVEKLAYLARFVLVKYVSKVDTNKILIVRLLERGRRGHFREICRRVR